ncbi:MAG: hypothetical protein V2I37_08785 [Marinilabiliaceae bacterium]|jgi:hypothetical protein|nr:hypothetical protein [Marinilabiliaceae bacterium]
MRRNLLLLTFLLLAAKIYSQNNAGSINSLISNTSISGQWFLGLSYDTDAEISSFNLKRGYFTIKTKLSDVLSVRYTQDITTDREGSDIGNVEMRLKYLYLKLDMKNIEALRNTYFEFGMVHRPWLDFEQKLNGYRVQGKMFTDRYNLTTSADFGITYEGLLGGEIDRDYQENVSKDYPGRLGSFAIGVFNGGGYHALEKNNNKVLEGRLTLRPLPELVPGVQLSYSFSYGKTNTVLSNGDYSLNLLYLSTQSRYHKLMGTWYTGKGSYDDDYMDQDGFSYKNDGYSVFAEIFIPETGLSLFSRYDKFISHQESDVEQDTFISGLTYTFIKNKVLIHYDQNKKNEQLVRTVELALEINF